MASTIPLELRYIDIGVNLTSPSFSGLYHSHTTPSHPADHSSILARARKYNVQHLLITGSDIPESRAALSLAQQYNTLHTTSGGLTSPQCWSTAGVHPCSANTLLPSPSSTPPPTAPQACESSTENPTEPPSDEPTAEALQNLRSLILKGAHTGTLRAIGELGIDYDRLSNAPANIQRAVFTAQLDLAVSLHTTPNTSERLPRPLPLFLHSRAAHTEFVALLKPHLPSLPARGVVHSFTGSKEEMRELVELGLDVGVNGCSLKTAENLEVVREIPLSRLQLETDAPWCEVRPSSAGMKVLDGSEPLANGNDTADRGGEPVGKGSEPTNGESKSASKATGYKTKTEILSTFPPSVKKEKWSEEAMVKGRNEPCMIGLVAEIVAGVKGLSVETVVEAAWRNSCRMFGFEEGQGDGDGDGGLGGVDGVDGGDGVDGDGIVNGGGGGGGGGDDNGA